MSRSYFGFKPYVPVATRRKKAQAKMSQLAKKGKSIRPVEIKGKTIAQSFWAKSWCQNLESYMDYANRLPRGRTYVRNGSVIHLDVREGEIEALVSGSEIYKVQISLAPLEQRKWQSLVKECSGGVGSLVELWQGKFSNQVMDILTRKGSGMFPSPKEIKIQCSCPDWANLCKHAAAVLYGVGARLDEHPELLFILRSVNHEDLLKHATQAISTLADSGDAPPEIAEAELSDLFGIELEAPASTDSTSSPQNAATPHRKRTSESRPKKRMSTISKKGTKPDSPQAGEINKASEKRTTKAPRKKTASAKKGTTKKPGRTK